jgi:phosphopantothenoylcysteine decarboxylase/phosphopantothenate--cysteine ligase
VLKGKSILLGVTGSVAAYKAIELIKRLRQEEASVIVIMTEAARSFVTPLSLELASGQRVCLDMFESPLSHVKLPAEADLFVVAPATANIIGKFAGGLADDLLSTALAAFRGKVIMAPAMNWRMYENPAFRRNLDYLVSIGVETVGPAAGNLACGEQGIGRMAETEDITEKIRLALTEQDFAGQHLLITAGPTREYLDPVRYLSNRSSGKMGYALAAIAGRRGAEVTLISGPSALKPPPGISVINVETASEMYRAVSDNISRATIFVMSAAVSDFAPVRTEQSKIDKKETFSLDLVGTTDILKEMGKLERRPFMVGFSAETGARTDRARGKLADKNLDMIVFNDVTVSGAGFDTDTNKVTLIFRDQPGSMLEVPLPMMSKEDVASAILDKVLSLKKESSAK